MEPSGPAKHKPIAWQSRRATHRLAAACLAVFVLSSLGIYVAEQRRLAGDSQVEARAVVWLPAADTQSQWPNATLPRSVFEVDPQEVSSYLLSNAQLRKAAGANTGETDRSRSESAEQAEQATCRGVPQPEQKAGGSLGPGRIQIRPITSNRNAAPGLEIRCRGATRQEAISLANRVAEIASQWIAETVRRRFDQSVRQAQTASDQARAAYHAAQARLEEFVEHHFWQHAVQASGPQAAPADVPGTEPSATTREVAKPTETEAQELEDGPAPLRQMWLELERLRRRRAELLETRTVDHPEIRFLESQIAELEAGLAGVTFLVEAQPSTPESSQPQEAPGAAAQPLALPVAPDPLQVLPAGSGSLAGDEPTVTEYRVLKRACEEAKAEYAERSEQLRQIWLVQSRLPTARVEPAQLLPHPAAASSTAVPFSLGLGLICALGVGLVFGWASIDPPLLTPEHVGKVAGVAVVGVLPRTAFGAPAPQPGTRLVRDGLLAGGALVLGAVVVALAWQYLW